jgi:excisionase family DNA binding protein
MVCMASPDEVWITVSEAAELIGCVDGYLRRLLAEGRLKGWKAGERAWLVERAAVLELGKTLTTRANKYRKPKKPKNAAQKRPAKG